MTDVSPVSLECAVVKCIDKLDTSDVFEVVFASDFILHKDTFERINELLNKLPCGTKQEILSEDPWEFVQRIEWNLPVTRKGDQVCKDGSGGGGGGGGGSDGSDGVSCTSDRVGCRFGAKLSQSKKLNRMVCVCGPLPVVVYSRTCRRSNRLDTAGYTLFRRTPAAVTPKIQVRSVIKSLLKTPVPTVVQHTSKVFMDLERRVQETPHMSHTLSMQWSGTTFNDVEKHLCSQEADAWKYTIRVAKGGDAKRCFSRVNDIISTICEWKGARVTVE